jgi:hypothetical protein
MHATAVPLVIDEMTASTNGRRFARSTSVTGRHGRRGQPPSSDTGNHCSIIVELPSGRVEVPAISLAARVPSAGERMTQIGPRLGVSLGPDGRIPTCVPDAAVPRSDKPDF